jgi:ribosome-associated protein
LATRKKTDEARKFAIEAARVAETNNCQDIVVLDLRGRSPVCDYFVIATGTSGRQMRTVADSLSVYGKSVGSSPWHIAGMEGADWIVLDFVDVVVHLFDEQHRRYYDLEIIWGEGPKVRWRKRATKKAADPAADESQEA